MTKPVILTLSVVALVLVVMAGTAVYARTMMGMSGNGGNHAMSEEQCENMMNGRESMMNGMTIEQCESIMGSSHTSDHHQSMMNSDHMAGMHGTANNTGGCH